MRKEIKKVPTIRFRGFTEDWEQRKLSDVAERVTRKNKNLESTLPLTISAQYGLIDQNEFFDKRIASKDVSGYYLIRKGEFAYNKSTSNDAPWGAIKRLNRYESGVLSTLYIVFCILDKSKTCSDYLASYYDTNLWHKEVKNIAAEGARNHGLLNIAPADFLDTKLMIPKNFEEQQMIGEYFSNLDNLITLHQRKLDQLKTAKTYFLQNMFPAKGEKVPRIRFHGFTGDWEQRKLGELCNLLTGYPFESKSFSTDGIKLIRGMNVKRGYLDFSGDICKWWKSSNGLENYLLQDNDILIQMDGALIGQSYAKINKNQLPALLVQRVTRARTYSEISNSNFIYSAIQKDFLPYIKENKTETAVPHLSLSDISNFVIKVPTLVEQKKIGNYFSNFDNLITLHQRKLDQLKTLKKFMLQNLFI